MTSTEIRQRKSTASQEKKQTISMMQTTGCLRRQAEPDTEPTKPASTQRKQEAMSRKAKR